MIVVVLGAAAAASACKSDKPKDATPAPAASPATEKPAAAAAPAAPKDCAGACAALLDCKVASGWFVAGVSLAAGENCKKICDTGRDLPPFFACLKSANGCDAISECWKANDPNPKAAAGSAAAPTAPAVVELTAGKTVTGSWDDAPPREVVWTPAAGTTVALHVVAPEGEEREDLEATVGGTKVPLAKFDVNHARGGTLAWHALPDGSLLVLATSGAASQDEGSASALQLTWDAKKKTVVIAKNWDGSELDKLPAWAKPLAP